MLPYRKGSYFLLHHKQYWDKDTSKFKKKKLKKLSNKFASVDLSKKVIVKFKNEKVVLGSGDSSAAGTCMPLPGNIWLPFVWSFNNKYIKMVNLMTKLTLKDNFDVYFVGGPN